MEVYRDPELASEINKIKEAVYTERGVNPPPPGGPPVEFESFSSAVGSFEQHQERMRQLDRLSNPNLRLPLTSHRGGMGRPIVFAKKAMRRLLKPITTTMLNTQEKFNSAVVETLAPFGGWFQNISDRLDSMEKNLLDSESAIKQNLARIVTIREEIEAQRDAVKKEFDNFVRETYASFENNDRAHQAMLDEQRNKIVDVERTLNDRLSMHEGDHKDVNELLQNFRSEQNYFRQLMADFSAKSGSASKSGDVAQTDQKSPRAGEENIYFEFENTYRGSQDDIRHRQEMYLALFAGKNNVLDIGCGRGEFLELLRGKGITASGLDYNLRMVDECLRKGLKVERADCYEYLAKVPDGSLGGIFAAQVIEHLPPNRLPEFFGLCYRKLAPEAPLVLETVNPLSLVSGAINFYIDLSHQNPLHPETMKFLAKSVGFRKVDIQFSALHPEEARLREIAPANSKDAQWNETVGQLNANIRRLNEVIFGYQDYAVIGYK